MEGLPPPDGEAAPTPTCSPAERRRARRVATSFVGLSALWAACFVVALEVEKANDRAWVRATGDQLRWARDERAARGDDAPDPPSDHDFVASNAYERRSGRPIAAGLGLGGIVVDTAAASTVTHADGAPRRWVVEGRHDSHGPTAELLLRDPGTYELRAKRDDEDAWTVATVTARVVRKELRALDDGDRARYFGALRTVYATDDDARAPRPFSQRPRTRTL